MVLTSIHDKDRFGFYRVGDLKFYSKFDAADIAVKTNRPLTWHYNDEIFASQNWLTEPNDTLEELYRQRAQQLRDRYDYLVLWFSGGADSDNILNVFVKNNIRLDEAAGLINMEATGDRDGYLNGEIYNLTVPKIQSIKEQSQPWIRHTLIDICQLTVDYFSQQKNRFDWVYKVNHYVNPNYTARTQVVKSQRHWMDLISSGKTVGFIHGVDKPRVIGINNKYSLVFRDILDAAAVTHNQIEDIPGFFNEMFYWSPDLPQMLIKQAHVIKKQLKKAEQLPQDFNKIKNTWCPMVTVNGQTYWMTTDAVHRALYPGWQPVPWQVKPGSLIFSPRDQWFFDLPDNDLAKQVWRQGLEYRWAQTPDWLKANPFNLRDGFKVLISQPYDLGT